MPNACGSCGATLPQGRKFCSHGCYVARLRDVSPEALVARFWAKVNQTPGCWIWTASTLNGYGQFHVPRAQGYKTLYAHRLSWALTYGPVPDNLFVLHRCDQPLCVRPDHLFLGTQADNLRDARQKGRLVPGRHLIKVSAAGRLDIALRYRPRHNGRQLAAEYGVSVTHLLRIVKAERFARVPQVDLSVRGDLHLAEQGSDRVAGHGDRL